MSTLDLRGVTKSLGGRVILDDVSLTVPSGTRASIVGASGSGKSTLLRLIAGFDAPDAGQIVLGDRALAGSTPAVAAHLRGVGYVTQDGALFPHLTVEANIRFGLPRATARRQRVLDVIELVGLDRGLLRRYPHELSGGQQQRVALARALAPQPQVVLLDEPFSALDTGLRAATRSAVIEALEQSRVTTILVTHDQEEALSFGDQIAVISGGRIAQAGHPSFVFGVPGSIETARFLGDAILLDGVVSGGRALTALGSNALRNAGAVPAEVVEGNAALRNTAVMESLPCIALVRPGQLTIDFDAAECNALVVAATQVGARVHVTLAITAQAEHLTVLLAVPDPGAFRAGRAVRVGVHGDVVVYPR